MRIKSNQLVMILIYLLVQGAVLSGCKKNEKPNILWMIAEDISPDIGCYGNELVHTPNIDQLAKDGIMLTQAFSTNPICSPSRSSIMTGMYQTSINSHNHRSHRTQPYILPDSVRLITDCLRENGYFTVNCTHPAEGIDLPGKTDFNFYTEDPFDGTDWDQREKGQPFFAEINFKLTHRTFLHDIDRPVNPDSVEIPPYYPDHPVTRADWALYLESIQILDKKIGIVMDRLKDEGLFDNTIIFFFGDHGRPHVRGKQWLYEGGIHIPLIVRYPDLKMAGTTDDKLISAIDITATTLNLAGIKVPGSMQGVSFLETESQPRQYIYAGRDRYDEAVDRIRCVRTSRFKYIRNFYTNIPYSQLNRYKEKQYPVIRLMRRLNAEGALTPHQAAWFAPERPAEELYDLQNDPYEMNNLASDPAMSEHLESLRNELDSWMHRTKDMGGIPEDSSTLEYYKQLMINRYNEDIKSIYIEEGMDISLIPDWE